MEQPPAIVIEGDACPDAARAEAALRDALGAAVAPTGGWRVRMNVRMRPSGVRVVAELDDGEALPVAHRELASASNRCEPLARGVGVWAALSLDAEVERAQRVEPKPAEPGGALACAGDRCSERRRAGAPEARGRANASSSSASPAR